MLFLTPLTALNKPDINIQQGFIPHPSQSENQIEFYYAVPDGPGPFPVLFILHGHQSIKRTTGGKELVTLHYLHRFVSEGIMTVAISAPGFGLSGGQRDFSGPYSQKAVLAVIDHFKQQPYVNPTRIGVYGMCIGATLASMVCANCQEISIQILESGCYDLVTGLGSIPDSNQMGEISHHEKALIERSALYHAEKLKASTLIVHGSQDDARGLSSAKELHKTLNNLGHESHLKVYSREYHRLPLEKWEIVIPFVKQHLLLADVW